MGGYGAGYVDIAVELVFKTVGTGTLAVHTQRGHTGHVVVAGTGHGVVGIGQVEGVAVGGKVDVVGHGHHVAHALVDGLVERGGEVGAGVAAGVGELFEEYQAFLALGGAGQVEVDVAQAAGVVALGQSRGLAVGTHLIELVVAVAVAAFDAVAAGVFQLQQIAVVFGQLQILGVELAGAFVGTALAHHVAGRVVHLPGGLLGLLVGVEAQLYTVGGLNGVLKLAGQRIAHAFGAVDVAHPYLYLVLAGAQWEVAEVGKGQGVALQVLQVAAPGVLLHGTVHLHVHLGAGQRVAPAVAEYHLPEIVRHAYQVGGVRQTHQGGVVLLLGAGLAVGGAQYLLCLHVLHKGHNTELLLVVHKVDVPR